MTGVMTGHKIGFVIATSDGSISFFRRSILVSDIATSGCGGGNSSVKFIDL